MMFGHVCGTEAWAKDYSSGLRERGLSGGQEPDPAGNGWIAEDVQADLRRLPGYGSGARADPRKAAAPPLSGLPADAGAVPPACRNWCQSAVFQANNRFWMRPRPKKRPGIRYNGMLRSLLLF